MHSQDSLIEKIRAFVETELFPLEPRFLSETFRNLLPELSGKREKVKKLGLWAPCLPKEYGGLGLSLPEYARVSEELGRSPVGHYVFNCQAPDLGNTELL